MALITTWISTFLTRDEEEGQGLAEYALILALIAIVAIVALIFLGGQVRKILSTVGIVRLVRRLTRPKAVGVAGGLSSPAAVIPDGTARAGRTD